MSLLCGRPTQSLTRDRFISIFFHRSRVNFSRLLHIRHDTSSLRTSTISMSMDTPWTVTPDELSRHFNVDAHTGLSLDQVRLHSERYGTNGARVLATYYPARCTDNGLRRKSFLRSQEHPSGSLSLSNLRISLSSSFLDQLSYHLSWPCSKTRKTPPLSVLSWSLR